jgi:predicted Ser/Thr protein kinase
LVEKKGKDVLTAAMKRLDHVFVTHPLELTAEREIQDGLFGDFEKTKGANGKPGHVAPHAKDIAALWAVMSRLTLPDDKVATEGLPFLAKKAAAYDGRMVEGVEEREVQEWYDKGQKTDDIEKIEGMDGLSVREMQTISNLVTGDLNVRDLNSMDGYAYLRIAREVLEKNRLTLSEDMKTKSLQLLTVAEQHLDEKVKGDVAEVLAGDPTHMQNIFDSYLNNVGAEKLGKKVTDPLTNEMVPPDRELMEDLESRMGLKSDNERHQYRNHLAATIGALKREGRQYHLENDPKLKKAILDRAYARTVDRIDTKVLLQSQNPSPRDAAKQNELVQRLMAKGYNEITANNALARVRTSARRDPKILRS